MKVLSLSNSELDSLLKEETLENPLVEITDGDFLSNEYSGRSELYQNLSRDSDIGIKRQLKSDICLMKLEQSEKEIADFLVDELDGYGFLGIGLGEAASVLNVPISKVRNVLTKLQDLEPIGVFAVDTKDYFNICLKRKKLDNVYARIIVNEYFDEFVKKNYKQIKQSMKISNQIFQKAKNDIESLVPQKIENGDCSMIVQPDIKVRYIAGKIDVQFNGGLNKKLIVNSRYQKMLSDEGVLEIDKQYIREKVKRIENINNALLSREKMIVKIAKIVFARQKATISDQQLPLKPLSMKEIAKQLSVSESTVSRAVREKYVDTLDGVKPLKSFFTNSLKTISGKDVSRDFIQRKIEALVAVENKKYPHSDEKLAKLLKEYQIDISRRTVAKYRSQLGIKSSSKRKCRER